MFLKKPMNSYFPKIQFDDKMANITEIVNYFKKGSIKYAHSDYYFIIHLHIYYLDQLRLYLEYIFNINVDHFLVITVTGKKNKYFYKLIKNFENLNIKIHFFENEGYDVLPFLKVLSLLPEKDCLLVKVHTKNIRDKISSDWSNEGLRSILLSDVYVESVIRRFESDKSLLMLGSRKLYKNTKKFMYENEQFFTCLFSLLSNKKCTIDMNTMGFFAGSIFWAKKSIFLELCEYMRDLKFDNSIQSSGSDGSIWHALERIFGILPLFYGGTISTVDFSSTGDFEFTRNPLPSLLPVTHTF